MRKLDDVRDCCIDFSQLLAHFIDVQNTHRAYKKSMRAKEMMLVERELSNCNLEQM